MGLTGPVKPSPNPHLFFNRPTQHTSIYQNTLTSDIPLFHGQHTKSLKTKHFCVEMSQLLSSNTLPHTTRPPIRTQFTVPSITIVHSTSWTLKSTSPVRISTDSSKRTSTVKCMANPRRVKMVAKQIRRELSDMLLTDKVLQYAVLPEAALGADRYLSSLTTISDVEVSGDLQVVKVYVSVFGDDRGKEVAIAGLKSKAKYVRSELGRRMKLRLTPEIRFIEDESFERGSRVIAILDKIKAEKEGGNRPDGEQFESPDSPQDESDWDGDDPDEDIIYVK